MKKIKAFFYVFIKSLTDPAWYREMLNTPTSFSIKYVFSLGLLLTVITAIGLTTFIPVLNSTIDTGIIKAKQAYPGDFVFEVKNGEWSINKPEPFIVPIPQEWGIEKQPNEEMPSNFLVFYKQGTINDLDNLDTFILVNDKNMIYKDTSKNKIEAYSLEGMQDGRFDRTTYTMAIDQLAKFKPYAAPTMIAGGGFLVFFASTIGRLFSLIFTAFFVWLIAKAIRYQNNDKRYVDDFGKAYRVAIHAATLPALFGLVVTVLSFLNVDLSAAQMLIAYFPSVYTIGFSIYAMSKSKIEE